MFIRFLQKLLPVFQSVLLGIVWLTLLTGDPTAAAQQETITMERMVSASSDDAEEDISGGVQLESTDLELVLDRSNQTVGMRFNQIEIPSGAKIISANIQFRASRVSPGSAALVIEGEATDNAMTFTTTEQNISIRPKTDATVIWSPEPWLVERATGPIQKTSDIASIIQEITLRPGWESGNSLVILMSGSGRRIAESYDGLAYAAPLLHVEYTLSGNLSPAVKIASPLHRSTFNQGNLVSLTAVAEDFEDGNLTANIAWISSLDGNIGTGGTVETSGLSVGEHTIQAIATDSAGMTGAATQTLTVFAPASVLVGAGDIAYEGYRDDETAKLLETVPGIVFTLGDNVYLNGTLEAFNLYYKPTWGRHQARTFPAIGDHEFDVPGAYGYYRYFGAVAGTPAMGYYSYDLGDWHIIVLNSECERLGGGCSADSQQGRWLQADLAANPGVCTLAYFHDPLFTSSTRYVYPNVQDFWRLLYNAEVDVILNGHAHNYERFAPQNPDGQADPGRGIRQFVVGTGGRSFTEFDAPALNSEARETGTAGVLKLSLHTTSYDWEFIPIAGQTFTDAGSADCVSSSPAPQTPTEIVSSPEAEPSIPTPLPTEENIPAPTATVVEIIPRTANDPLNPLIPACAALPVPFLAYLFFVFRRRSRR